MKLESEGGISNRIVLVFLFIFSFCITKGQQSPLNPVSYWVFVPYIYNPAIVGSKDFLSIGINAEFQGESNAQLISGNTRIKKTDSGYFSSPGITEFRNLGIGGSVYKRFITKYWNKRLRFVSNSIKHTKTLLSVFRSIC